MNELDLDARLERLAATAAGAATVPDPQAIVRRGRRGRRRRLAGTALLVAAVAATPVLLPARLAGRTGPATDDGPVTAPTTDTRGAAGFAGYWFGKVDVSVFLTDPVEPARRQAILDRIRSAGVAEQVYHESRAEAYTRFRAQFQHQPELLSGVGPASLPESFRVLLDDPAHAGTLYRLLCPDRDANGTERCINGVDSVIDEHAVVEPALVGAFWPRTTDVTVLLVDGATAAQRAAVRARLEATGRVRRVTYESPADALRRLRELRSAEQLRLTPGSPPGSFRVALRDPRQTAAFVDAFCHSRRTGDCAEGVAMVIAHPRR
jgi:cell division protein FtsX